MNYLSVFRVLGVLCAALAATLGVPLLSAIGSGERPQVVSFSITIVALAVIAALLLVLTTKPTRRARATDGLAVAILWWIAAPIAAAPPFILGVAETSILSAIHEAASCLTTSGHSVIAVGEDGWPRSLIVYRASLHTLGAWMTVTIAASVFAALNLGGPGIHRTVLFTIPDESFFDAVPRVASAVAWMFAIIILLLFSALVVVGVDATTAVTTAVSVAATGLVDPQGPMPDMGFAAEILVLVGLTFSSVGLGILLDLRKQRVGRAMRDPEWVTYVAVVLVILAGCLAVGASAWPALNWTVSSVSTSGISFESTNLNSNLPTSFLLPPAIIGGSGLSAAGGVKLARLFVLVKRAGQEFSRLGYPQSVVSFTFRGREQSESVVIGVWVYLIAYVVAAFAAVGAFSAMNITFDASMLVAVGALSNAGALVERANVVFNESSHALATGCLVLGRLEILALLPALNPSFWRG